MIFNITSGGGTALNFRVVGGTTAPANPAENCIWVNTDTPITSWIFSAEEPSPAEAGMVWFPVGTSSPVEFNALRKNSIQVYPQSAKQMVSGSLVDVEAKTYQGGEWVDWITWLYKDGNQYTEVTGGWNAVNESAMGISFDDDIKITWKGGSNIGGYFCATKQIDLTDKSWLQAQGLITNRYDSTRFIEIALCKNLPSNFVYTADSYARLTTMNNATQMDVDVRALSGKYYIVVNCAGITGTVSDIGVK